MPAKPASRKPAPETQLRSFIDGFDPKEQRLFRSVRSAIRKRFPTANELAYKYSNQIVISYSPTEGGIDGLVSIALRADGVRLYINQSVQLPDPKKLLLGSGRQARYIQLEAASTLADPDVEALIAGAIDRAKLPFPSRGGGNLIIRTGGAK